MTCQNCCAQGSIKAVPQSPAPASQQDSVAEFTQADLPPAPSPIKLTFLPMMAAGEGPASDQGMPAAPPSYPSGAGTAAYAASPTASQDVLMEVVFLPTSGGGMGAWLCALHAHLMFDDLARSIWADLQSVKMIPSDYPLNLIPSDYPQA